MIKEPKMPTPEEMAKINKERKLSDAELIKGDAEVTPDDRIIPTEEQIKDAKIEMGEHFYKKATELERKNEEDRKEMENSRNVLKIGNILEVKYNGRDSFDDFLEQVNLILDDLIE